MEIDQEDGNEEENFFNVDRGYQRKDSKANVKQTDILWIFNNVDQLPKPLWSRLEARLEDMYQNNLGLRIIFGSTKKL